MMGANKKSITVTTLNNMGFRVAQDQAIGELRIGTSSLIITTNHAFISNTIIKVTPTFK